MDGPIHVQRLLEPLRQATSRDGKYGLVLGEKGPGESLALNKFVLDQPCVVCLLLGAATTTLDVAQKLLEATSFDAKLYSTSNPLPQLQHLLHLVNEKLASSMDASAASCAYARERPGLALRLRTHSGAELSASQAACLSLAVRDSGRKAENTEQRGYMAPSTCSSFLVRARHQHRRRLCWAGQVASLRGWQAVAATGSRR